MYEWDATANGGNGDWDQLGSDINGEATDDYSGWSVSLSSDGSIVAIGAIYNGGNGSNSGNVRVFLYSDTNDSWSQLGGDIDGEASGDYSGHSVSLSNDGTIVAIGANGNDGNGSASGHVRVYQYSNSSNNWSQLGDDIDGEAADDQSGHSLSLSDDGSIVAIGAPYNDGSYSDSGHVRVYENISGTWTQLGADIDGAAGGDYSGRSVSLSSDGTIVAIGANKNDDNGNNSGHVIVYQYSSSTTPNWTQLGADIDGEASYNYSGWSVSLSNDGSIVAIGAIYNAAGGNSNSGHVRVYENKIPTQNEWDNGNVIKGADAGNANPTGGTKYWVQLGTDIDGEASGDYSGWSVALSNDGTIVAIGANKNDDNEIIQVT